MFPLKVFQLGLGFPLRPYFLKHVFTAVLPLCRLEQTFTTLVMKITCAVLLFLLIDPSLSFAFLQMGTVPGTPSFVFLQPSEIRALGPGFLALTDWTGDCPKVHPFPSCHLWLLYLFFFFSSWNSLDEFIYLSWQCFLGTPFAAETGPFVSCNQVLPNQEGWGESHRAGSSHHRQGLGGPSVRKGYTGWLLLTRL